MIRLINDDNMNFWTDDKVDVVYADMIYEKDDYDKGDFDWIDHHWEMLRDGGIFIVQTDWHSVFDVGYHLKRRITGSHMLNEISWKNEFGNFPKNKFRQSHDNIIIFSKGKDYKFYPDRVQVPKATAKSKGLNPSGRTTKLATSVWLDICLTTVAKERVKKEDGVGLRWQKPLKLMDRLMMAYTDEGDTLLDPFMGSGTLGLWAKRNNRDYIGIEYDIPVFEIAKNRINND